MKKLMFSYSRWFGYTKEMTFLSNESDIYLLHNKKKDEFVVVHINPKNQQGYSHFKKLENAKDFYRSLVTSIIDDEFDNKVCKCFAERI